MDWGGLSLPLLWLELLPLLLGVAYEQVSVTVVAGTGAGTGGSGMLVSSSQWKLSTLSRIRERQL